MKYNQAMKELPLSKGKVAIVDSEDFEHLNQWKWSLNGMGRAHRKTSDNKNIMLHRFIMGTPRHLVVHHINGDPLDNRRSNLVNCTQSENLKHKLIYSNNTSGYKGVTFNKRNGKWLARTFKSGKQIYVGYFDTPELAHLARGEKT